MEANEYSRPGSDQSGFENRVDEMPLGILSCDREGNIIATNDFLLDILVSPSADATREINMLTFPPLVESGISATVEKALVTGNNAFIETSYASKQGKELFLGFKVFPLKDENGIICACNAIVEDLTNKNIAREKTTLNEELYTSLVEQLVEAVFVTDIEGHIFEVNDHASEMLGYSKEDLKEMTIHDLHIPEHRENGLNAKNKLQMEGAEWEETKYATAKGDIIDVEVNARLLKGHHGIIQVVVRDVTERKREEEIIRKREQKYRKLFENNKNAIVITKMIRDENGYPVDFVFMESNKAFEKHTGLKTEEVLGKRVTEVYPGIEKRKNTYLDLHRNVALTGIPVTVELYSEELKTYFNITAYQIEKDIVVGTFENIEKRKRAEEKLSESEEKLRQLIEHLPFAVTMLDRNMRHIAASRQWLRTFSLEEQDITGKYHYDILPLVNNDYYKEIHQRALKGEVIRKDEDVVKMPGGKIIFNRWEVRPWKTVDGKIGGIIIFSEDISERKIAEENLRKSERKYRKLFENNKSAVVITKMIRDENGYPVDFVHLEVNAAYDKLSVLKSKDVIGKTASELLPGTDIQENPFIGLHRDVALTGIPISVELYSEELKEYFSITAYQSEKDIIVGVSENITERKEAEEKLIRSEYKYRSLFEKSNDIIIVHHVDGKIVDANKKAYEVLGYSEEELLQKNIMDIIMPEDHKIVIDDLKEISDLKDINDRNSPRKEVRAIKSDGAVLYVDVSVSVIKDRKNLVMAVARDITDRIKYEEAMLKAKIEAETASRAKSEFLTTMSHELRTPLNSIIGFSESMLDGIAGELEEKPQKYLQNISKSGTHLLEVINDILDISKIEAGKMQLYFEMVNVNSFITDMITMIQPLAGNKELNLIADIPNDIPDISADKAKFKQVMSNLLGNAVKFTNRGGTISISCRSEDSKLVFSVTDTGIGISEADQNKLFEPFTQIDSSISRKYAGTGLGLALVKEIIELHQGKIWVESEPGKGSSFVFELPVEHADTLINREYPEKRPPYL